MQKYTRKNNVRKTTLQKQLCITMLLLYMLSLHRHHDINSSFMI